MLVHSARRPSLYATLYGWRVHAGTWCSTTLCSRPSRYIYPWPLASVTMLAVLAQCPIDTVSHKVCKMGVLAASQCLRTLGYNCIFTGGYKHIDWQAIDCHYPFFFLIIGPVGNYQGCQPIQLHPMQGIFCSPSDYTCTLGVMLVMAPCLPNTLNISRQIRNPTVQPIVPMQLSTR